MVLTFDCETSIYNKGNPFDERNFVVSTHFCEDEGSVVCKFYDDPDFKSMVRNMVERATLFIGVNCKFDIAWLRNLGIQLPSGCRVWDCMLAEFILSGQKHSFASLNKLAEHYKLGKKSDVVAEYWAKGISTEDIPRDIVEEYGNLDVSLTSTVYQHQLKDPRMSPELHRLILLDGLDLLVLSDMECNGFPYNVDGSLAKAATLRQELEKVDEELHSFSPVRFNLDSGDWLSCFLYGGTIEEDVFKPVDRIYQGGPKKGEAYVRNEFQHTLTYVFEGFFKPLPKTELKKEGFYSTAEDTLVQLKATTKKQKRIIELLGRRAYITKLCGTYLEALPKLIEDMHWKDNIVHGQYNQVVARTGRLSSSRPNMQNSSDDVDEFFISRFN